MSAHNCPTCVFACMSSMAESGDGVIDEANYVNEVSVLDAAAILDGKQVASVVAPPTTPTGTKQ